MSESVSTWGAPPVKFGVGATDELGFDLRQLGIERVLVVTDPGAVGGGSSIDTAKAINLLTAGGHDVMEYVNRPVGQGRSPQAPLKPLVAVPTTRATP
jgi:hydroxyacid-oxoacid transhydrogenase